MMPVKNRFAELQSEITAWRHDFHAHPELLYDVHRTAARVAELLTSFGCDDVVTGIGRTGVVGVIKGRTNTANRVVGLRADMDALPIKEQTGLAYASKTEGKMHACGHDGHTAMLLGAAKYLAETRNFDGTTIVIFQPAEEGGGGGKAMVEDQMMQRWNIQEVYGMHNMPGIPLGEFAIRAGSLMASSDLFDIVVTGKGGHAAMPHKSIDTTLISAHIIIALQSIASRNVDPLLQSVVSVCAVETDTPAYNVIPEVVTMRGTVRTLDPDVQEMIQRRVTEIAEGTAKTFGAKAVVNYRRGYPVTVNHDENTNYAADVAKQIVGAGKVDINTPPLMGAEDFSFMLKERPGAYIFMGNGDTAQVHHPLYNFNDEAIPFGCSWFAGMVESRMPIA
jgi:amidohydrolase